MKNKQQKFKTGEKVILKAKNETVTVKGCNYVANMKSYAYTLKEYPNTFYFEKEIETIE